MVENAPSCDIPVRARGYEHYLEVFPDVFPLEGRSVLIIGSGLSNAVLAPGVVAIDPSFVGTGSMFDSCMKQISSSKEMESALETNAYINVIRRGRKQNSHLVAAKIGLNCGLPFPKNHFDVAISSNCIFGGLEVIYSAEEMVTLLENSLSHVKGNQSLYVYPHFCLPPRDVLGYVPLYETDLYSRFFEKQLEVVTKLHGRGIYTEAKVVVVREERLPPVIHTLRIHT